MCSSVYFIKHRKLKAYGTMDTWFHNSTMALDGGDGQFHAPAALTLEKSQLYKLDRRLAGPQIRSGCCEEQKNISTTGNQTPTI
jgi:hypothetical protein